MWLFLALLGCSGQIEDCDPVPGTRCQDGEPMQACCVWENEKDLDPECGYEVEGRYLSCNGEVCRQVAVQRAMNACEHGHDRKPEVDEPVVECDIVCESASCGSIIQCKEPDNTWFVSGGVESEDCGDSCTEALQAVLDRCGGCA